LTGIRTICLLGLGEVGTVLADHLSDRDVSLVTWDRQFSDAGSKASRNAIERKQLRQAASAEMAAEGCDLVISAVTAAQDLDAARSVLLGLEHDAWFLDLNSVAPATRQSVADIVQHAGGRYVEAAIMSPIRPEGIASPMLAGGPNSLLFIPIALKLGFVGMKFCSERIGPASATKMCRSVVVKGLESLLVESLLAARYHGVDEAVLTSLSNLVPHDDWPRQARYMISRTLEHGSRRAEEMHEVARTVAEAGLEGRMSEACAHSQAQAARFGKAADEKELTVMLDAMLAMLPLTVTETHAG
jgi:3-hydroxyisobutyrate dehydrogenase-like beta-hydroxyacid dehydrogenase